MLQAIQHVDHVAILVKACRPSPTTSHIRSPVRDRAGHRTRSGIIRSLTVFSSKVDVVITPPLRRGCEDMRSREVTA